jgi:hypothetical protein
MLGEVFKLAKQAGLGTGSLPSPLLLPSDPGVLGAFWIPATFFQRSGVDSPTGWLTQV